MKYRYYVPYFHKQGTGYSIMDMPKKIETKEDIDGLISDIEKINNVTDVIIINWIMISKTKNLGIRI